MKRSQVDTGRNRDLSEVCNASSKGWMPCTVRTYLNIYLLHLFTSDWCTANTEGDLKEHTDPTCHC